MTDLSVITAPTPSSAPPPYDEAKALIHQEKAPLHLTSPASPASSSGEYEKVVCEHDIKLSPRNRAIRIGVTVVNPAFGIALAICPNNRRRTCRTCGTVVVVPRKKLFC